MLWPAASVGVGALLVYGSLDPNAVGNGSAPSVTVTPRAAGPSAGESGPSTAPAGPALPRSVPKRLRIPIISVDAPFIPLTLNATGQLNPPPPNNNNLVGWYQRGPTPGERGTSIVAGHFDTLTGPAVFVGLSEVKPGNKIEITREDNTVATFKVDSVESFSKAKFPNERVYNDTPSAQLRLITCAGEYDRTAKDYTENLVVFAHLESSRRVPAPAVPKTPAVPKKPAVPKAPATSAAPVAPAVPKSPAAPVVPKSPAAPVVPKSPAAPVAPAVPKSPAAPVVPKSPAAPAAPAVPKSPAAPAAPVVPKSPAAPAAPAVPKSPAAPAAPAAR
ncbi:class F sortase [Streptomyces sp. NPDC001514]